jgi:AhpD family alkylhydroperoxidase
LQNYELRGLGTQQSGKFEFDEPPATIYFRTGLLEKFIESSKLTRTHKELIKIRASQINGCAFCLDMHSKDARKNGETARRPSACRSRMAAGFLKKLEPTKKIMKNNCIINKWNVRSHF